MIKKQEYISEQGIYVGPEMKWGVEDVVAEMQEMNILESYKREDLEAILVATFKDNDHLMQTIADHIKINIAVKFNLPNQHE
tara:strand:- start:689 stop:934 length:246 start_codon:yes stop_codon:yes gene_type:complete